MSKSELGSFSNYTDYEKAWLNDYVGGGYFNPLFVDLLRNVHDEIAEDPKKYLQGLVKFEYQTFTRDLTPGKIGRAVRNLQPKIFVSRLVVPQTGRGVGFNLVFSPNDPSHKEVSRELYPRYLSNTGANESTMPFGVLWADAYYFQGLAYWRGNRHGDVVDSGYEVFEHWDLTWAHLHTDNAAFFKLNPPYLPKDSKKILNEIISEGKLH